MSIRVRTLVRCLLPAMLFLSAVACTEKETSGDDIVKVEKTKPAANKHDFKVDKDGKVVFKAEIVYFKYDDHTLTSEGMERLNSLADYLKSRPAQKLTIEGHCDERGSTEYNLALGQMRSQSVRKYLAEVGVPESRLATVTFGEERPAANGNDESSWSQNRRAEFTLTSAEAQ